MELHDPNWIEVYDAPEASPNFLVFRCTVCGRRARVKDDGKSLPPMGKHP